MGVTNQVPEEKGTRQCYALTMIHKRNAIVDQAFNLLDETKTSLRYIKKLTFSTHWEAVCLEDELASSLLAVPWYPQTFLFSETIESVIKVNILVTSFAV